MKDIYTHTYTPALKCISQGLVFKFIVCGISKTQFEQILKQFNLKKKKNKA